MVFCVNCGTELQKDWNLCPNCGTNRLPVKHKSRRKKRRISSKSKNTIDSMKSPWIGLVHIICSVIIVSSLIVILYSPAKANSPIQNSLMDCTTWDEEERRDFEADWGAFVSACEEAKSQGELTIKRCFPMIVISVFVIALTYSKSRNILSRHTTDRKMQKKKITSKSPINIEEE